MEPTALVPSKPIPPANALACYTPLEERLAQQAETERLGERIAELTARITAATYQLLLLIRDFDQRGGWACGFRSCAHWLSWRTGVAMGAAREKVRVARALGELPKISEAMRTAEVSYSKVRALTRVATPDNEERLLRFAIHATASQVERFIRAWRRVDRTAGDGGEAERQREALRHASRYLHVAPDGCGMVVVRGRLEPEVGAVLMRAIEAASEVLYEKRRVSDGPPKDGTSFEQRRADAMGLLAEAALGSGLGEDAPVDTRADRYQVVVHVEAEVLDGLDDTADVSAGTSQRRDRERLAGPKVPETADRPMPGVSEIEDTGGVSAETSRRLACDASTVTMTHDSEGGVLDVGRKTRVISPALRRALNYRDKTCRFPGCDLRHCDAHHVHHWGAGGETRLDNLVLLCRRHHRSVHEEGFRVETAEDGEFRFFDPAGRVLRETPPTPAFHEDPLTLLAEQLVEAGVDPEELDHYPKWDGSSLNLVLAIDSLWSQKT